MKQKKTNKDNRMVIISLDAVGARDLEFMRTLPNFGKFMEQSAICSNVQSVYPSVTYPAHTSIITGKKPVNHGVINNTLLQPERESPDWMWQRHFIRGTTLFDEAIDKGCRVAALLWPVTAKSRIQYCLPEVLANRPWQNQIVVSALNGTFGYQIEMLLKFGEAREGVRQPQLDNFIQKSTLHTIRKYNPDLLLVHFTDVDTNRHIYGVEHEEIKKALRRHDTRLGEIMKALEETGDMNKTTVVLLGDHCQADTRTVVYFNYLFKEKGFLKTKGTKITDYDFVAKNCDGSCYIYANPNKHLEENRYQELADLLMLCKEDETFGIEEIFTSREAGELGADDSCVCMIEAKPYFYYLDEAEVLTCPTSEARLHKMLAVHGYLPSKEDNKTFFMASGFGIQPKSHTEEMNLYDEGPTLAKIMGLELPDADGKVISEILNGDIWLKL